MNKGNELTLGEKAIVHSILSLVQMFDNEIFLTDGKGYSFQLTLTANEMAAVESAAGKLFDAMEFETT